MFAHSSACSTTRSHLLWPSETLKQGYTKIKFPAYNKSAAAVYACRKVSEKRDSRLRAHGVLREYV